MIAWRCRDDARNLRGISPPKHFSRKVAYCAMCMLLGLTAVAALAWRHESPSDVPSTDFASEATAVHETDRRRLFFGPIGTYGDDDSPRPSPSPRPPDVPGCREDCNFSSDGEQTQVSGRKPSRGVRAFDTSRAASVASGERRIGIES